VTDRERTLGSRAANTPTIAPFKRVTALDTVAIAADDGVTPVLGVGDLELETVPVEGATSPAPDDRPRDRFWGSVVLDFSEGTTVPLPSVSPESRILTVRTEPHVSLAIAKDRADNYFAVATGTLPSKQIRLTFLTDAPRGYFNAPIPEVASDVLADEAPSLPEGLEDSALTFAGEIGVTPGIAIGSAHVVEGAAVDVPEYRITKSAVGRELRRFAQSVVVGEERAQIAAELEGGG